MQVTWPALLLAGDVGATKTNLALFTAVGEAHSRCRGAFRQRRLYAGLEDVVRAFLAREACIPTAACFGVAGPVADGRTPMPNLGWRIDALGLGRLLALERVVLLNALEATAYGIATLPPDQLLVLRASRSLAATPRSSRLAPVSAKRSSTGTGHATASADRRAATPISRPATRRRCRSSRG
jgi:glucokinase